MPQFAKHTDAFRETPTRPHAATKTSQIDCERSIEGVGMGYVKGRTTRKAKSDTTWLATQVGPRTVKAGLGGHEAGVFGVDEGTTNPSTPLLKRERMALSVCAAFSDFIGVEIKMTVKNETVRQDIVNNDTLYTSPYLFPIF